MRIRKLQLKNIGTFNSAEFEFKPQAEGKAEVHILTGPNGSGKTTILYALASVFDNLQYQNSESNRPSNYFAKRFWHFKNLSGNLYQSELIASFDEGETVKIFGQENGRLSYTTNNSIIDIYKHSIFNTPLQFEFEFSVLAYSGYRYVKSTKIISIQESTENPLLTSLEFYKQPGFTINQWIANNISKQAIAEKKKDTQASQRYADVITILQKTISEVIGTTISFELNLSPLDLVVKINNTELDFDVLPDGVRSLVGWIGDLLMRLDQLKWKNDVPVNEHPLILLLDEIEIHLHPAWQRKVLPAVQKLFPNAQIFLSTHSPFVVNSIDGAAVYELKVKDGKASLSPDDVSESKSSASYRSVLREVFDIEKPFGGETQDELDKFQQQRDQLLRGEKVNEKQFMQRGRKLAKQSEELLSIISLEIKQINKIKGTNYEL
jgi:predicted ATP-binding protein involved in virulence